LSQNEAFSGEMYSTISAEWAPLIILLLV